MSEYNNKKQDNSKGLTQQLLDLVQDSIDSMDFSGLSERIRETVEDTRDEINRQVRNLQNGYYSSSPGSSWHNPGTSRRADGSSLHNAGKERWHYRYGHYRREPQTIEIPEPGQPKSLPGIYSGPVQMAVGGTGLAIFGGISLGFGLAAVGVGLAGGVITAATVAIESIFLPLTVASGVFLGRGVSVRNRARRLKEYISEWTGRSYIMLSELQEKSGQSIKQIREDILYLTDNDLLPGACMDQQQTCLMLTDEAISQYEAARQSQQIREEEEARRKQEEEALAREKASRWEEADEEEREFLAFIEDAESTLSSIDEYQNSIRSGLVLKKLDRLELLLTRIFVCVKEHPEKLRLTRRLMDYYVPSVLRLLSVYRDMESQPIQGDNIQKTLQEIEDSLDTINDALETMFDELFQEEALDVSADIQVLKTMLAQDGWTKDPINQ